MFYTSKAKRHLKHYKLQILRVTALIAGLCSSGPTLAEGFREAPGDTTGSLLSIDPNPVRRLSYAIGDKLKVTVLEQIRSDPRVGDARGFVETSAVERTDLSGDYIVQEDGNIYMPGGGPIGVAGASFRELEQAIGASLGAKLNASVKIGIQVLEREPVYVTGPVVKTGAYKHIPGMSVLHALVLAGALDTAAGDQWRLLDWAREKERLLKSTEHLSRLVVRLDLLKAEREEVGAPANRPRATLPESKDRLAEAEILRHVERAKRAEQEAATDASLQSYRTELSIQRDKLHQVEASLQGKAERMQSVNKYRERGTTTDITFFQAGFDLAEAKERLHDAKAVLAQLEHKVSDLQHEKVRMSVEARFDREREIRDLENAISEEEVTRAALSTLLMQARGGYTAKIDNKELDLTIVRRTPRGLQRSAADENSPLEPGDILQISPSKAGKAVSVTVGRQ